MKRTHVVLAAVLLLSSALVGLTGFPPNVNAVELTPVPYPVQINTNLKESLSVSASDDGRIYIVWSERVAGNTDVYYSFSSNNGTTFSPASRVNRESAGAQVGSQVATANGNLYIVWQDRALDGGDIILARSEDGGRTFEEIRVSDREEGTQSSPTIAASGDRVAVAWREELAEHTLRVWDDTGAILRELEGHQGAVRAAAYSPNGTYIASGSEDNTVRIWNAATGAQYRNLTHHTREVTSVAWSSDGGTLATGSWDQNVFLMDTSGFGTARVLNSTDGVLLNNVVSAIDFSLDGSQIAVAYNGAFNYTGLPSEYFNLTVWNTSDWSNWTVNEKNPEPDQSAFTSSLTDVAFSHGGTYLAVGGTEGRLKAGDVSIRGYTLKVFNPATGQTVRSIRLNQPVHSVAWSPNDTHIAAGLGNGTIALVNVTDWSVSWLGRAHTGRVNSLDWGMARNELLSGASDPVAKAWHNDTVPGVGVARLNVSGHINSVYAVSWSPGGGTFLTASGNSLFMKESQLFCTVSDNGGLTFSPPASLADSNAGHRFSPEVAIDPSGVISVAWYDYRMGQHIYFANSTDGTSFGRNIGVDTVNTHCVTPQIFVDSDGVAHVAWQHGTGPGTNVRIRYANSLDNFATSRLMATGAQVPRVAGSPDGSSVWVAWRFQNQTAGTNNTLAAISYDRGASFAKPLTLNTTRSSIGEHAVFVDTYNQTYVAWEIGENIYHRTTVMEDRYPPILLSASPPDGATDVSIFTEFTFYFSEPMGKDVTEASFSWTDGVTTWYVGDCVGNRGTWNPYGDTVRFRPRTPLQYQTSYSFRMASTALDLSGNALGANFTFSFETGQDTDPPFIEHYPSQATVSYDEQYHVAAVIRDYWGTVEEARLFYQGVDDDAPATSIDMSLTAADTYQATIPPQNALGTIYYFIYASDAHNNKAWNPVNYTNQSQLYSVSVVDGVKPEITHLPVAEADVFREIEVWAVVTDSIQLQSVHLSYRPLGSSLYVHVPMLAVNGTPNTFRHVIPAQDNIGMVHYNISAMDASGNFNSTPTHAIRIMDRIAPLINSVTPEPLDNQTRVRVRANVTDDVAVGTVTLYFRAVGGRQWVERPMIHVSGDIYEFVIPAQRRSGSIYYYVNATDTSGNTASSLFEQDEFKIEVVGVGPDYTLYYALGAVLAFLMVLLVYLLVRRFSGSSGGPATESPEPPEPHTGGSPREPDEEMPREPEESMPERVDESP